MKPIYLSIQAFGPFSNTQTIDFSKLGHNPLFLINGPTGAGKSSILDAMCFALYGDTTGKEREASSMRCDLANENTPTEIIFEFTLQNSLYRIVRTPAQEVAKKSGKGTTNKGPTAMVYKRNGNVENKDEDDIGLFSKPLDLFEEEFELLPLKGVTEVNKWVEKETGLNSEQFRQVMVLPQGQFRKLLLAESNQREEIFSKLFQTKIYKDIEDNLKEQSASLRKDRETLFDKLSGLLESINLTKVEQLDEQLKKINPEFIDAKAKYEQSKEELTKADELLRVGNIVSGEFKDRVRLIEKLNELKGQGENIDELKIKVLNAQNASKIFPVLENLKKAQDQLTQEHKKQEKLTKSSSDLLIELNEVEKLYPKIELQFNSLDDKKSELSQWVKRKEILSAWNEHSEKFEIINNRNVACDLKKKEFESNIVVNQKYYDDKLEEIKNNDQKLKQLPQINADLDRFKALGKIKRQIVDLQKEHLNAKEKVNTLIIQEQASKQDVILQETNVLQLELSWHKGQAFELARKLKKDEACLVCGSTSHPNIAKQKIESVVTKEQIDSARLVLTQLESVMAKYNLDHNVLLTELKNIDERIIELECELKEDASQDIQWFREQYAQVKAQKDELESLQLKQGENEITQQNLKVHIKQQQEALELVNKELTQLLIKRTESQTIIDNLENQIPSEFRNIQVIDEKIRSVTSEIAEIQKSYEKITSKINKLKNDISTNKTLIDDSEARLNTFVKEEKKINEKWVLSLKDHLFSNEQEFNKAHLEQKTQLQYEQSIEKYKIEYTQLETKISQIDEKLKDKSDPNIDELQQKVELAKQNCEKTEKTLTELTGVLDSLKRVQSKISQSQTEIENIDTQYKVIGTLSDVASGKSSKVSLQRYVLGVLLDDVLSEASQRLLLMSKGRYILKRKLDKTKGNKSSGLDLEVEDAYSGMRRPANTLSGGESFMAALSLALGLSDVVQNYCGGIKLDTLFIDEGFGSLDVESLDLAIQTLVDLRNAGRTIGVISHVSELKEQMTQRIDLTPSSSGSLISVFSG